MCTKSLTDSKYTDKVEVLLNDYEYIEENGKAFFVKKKKEYPKTYEECCKVLGVDPDNYLTIRNVHCYDGEEDMVKYENDLLNKFGFLWKLIICRNAYWEIAREEIGLNKSWEPDWNDEKQDKYGLFKELKNTIINPASFVFPTEEMRDKFHENFKDYFNKCGDR